MPDSMSSAIYVDDVVFAITAPTMITSLKKKSDEIIAAIRDLVEAINNATTTDDLSKGFDEVRKSYDTLMSRFNPGYIAEMRELSTLMTHLFFGVFMGFEEEKYPIDERLDKVQSYLHTTNLHQYRYLDIASFIKGVKDAVESGILEQAEPENCCYIDPVDMYVKTILTRTIVYLRRLNEADLIEAPQSAIGIAGIYAETLCTGVQNDLEAIDTMIDKIVEMLPGTVSDPNKVLNIKNASDIVTDRLSNAILPIMETTVKCFGFYTKLLDVLKDSRDTIEKAYELYKDSFAVTF